MLVSEKSPAPTRFIPYPKLMTNGGEFVYLALSRHEGILMERPDSVNIPIGHTYKGQVAVDFEAPGWRLFEGSITLRNG